jgi:tetratricopeptide (TPR) repeat protein
MSIRQALLVAGLLIPHLAVADTPLNITRGEVALLPPYCPDSQTFGLQGFREGPHPKQQVWIAEMGQTFWAIHHYCWALVSASRAKRAGVSAQQRVGLYQAAIADSYYVLEHSQPDFVLLPEIYLRMGQFAIGAGDPVRAAEFFEKSRERKPDYWPAYVELANLNISLGRKQVALEAVQAGLLAVPDQANLKELLTRLKTTVPSKAGGQKMPTQPPKAQ